MDIQLFQPLEYLATTLKNRVRKAILNPITASVVAVLQKHIQSERFVPLSTERPNCYKYLQPLQIL